MALIDRFREAWNLHKEDREMQERFSTQWQARPADEPQKIQEHLERITQPTIDRYITETKLKSLRSASPEQVEHLIVRLENRTGITEDSARLAVLTQRRDPYDDVTDSIQRTRPALRENMEFERLRETFWGNESAFTVHEHLLDSQAKKHAEPVLQRLADQSYNGRMDLIQGGEDQRIVDRITEVSGIPYKNVERAVSDIRQDAIWQREAEEDSRLYAAVKDRDHEYVYKRQTGDIFTYKHVSTGKEIHLDTKGESQDTDHGKLTLVSRAEVTRASPENSQGQSENTEATRRAWEPLEKAIGYEAADQYRHYGERDNIQVYGRVIEEQKITFGVDDKGQFYDLERAATPTPIGKEAAMDMTRFVPPEQRPPSHNQHENFTWKQESGGIHSYEHNETGRHVHIDMQGQYYSQDRQPITQEAAMNNVLHQPPTSERAKLPDTSSREVARPQAMEQNLSL